MLIGVKAILRKVGQIIMQTARKFLVRRYLIPVIAFFASTSSAHSGVVINVTANATPPMLRAKRVLSWKRLRRARDIGDTYLEFK